MEKVLRERMPFNVQEALRHDVVIGLLYFERMVEYRNIEIWSNG